MRIRNYTPVDLDVCRSLWAEMVQQHRDIYEDQSIGGDNPGLEFDKHLELVGLDRIWLAETEGEVIGFTSLIKKDQLGIFNYLCGLAAQNQMRGKRVLIYLGRHFTIRNNLIFLPL